MNRLSVRTQLTLWNISIVALALTLFGIALRFGVQRILLTTVDHDLVSRMDQALRPGHHLPGAPPQFNDGRQGPPDGPPRPDDPLGLGPPPRNDDGNFRRPPRPRRDPPPPIGDGLPPHWFRSANQGDQRPELPPYSPPYSEAGYTWALDTQRPAFSYDTAAGGKSVRVYSYPLQQLTADGDSVPGVFQVGAVIDFIQAADNGVTVTLLLLIPAALLLTGVGGALLTNRALHPVDTLGHALNRIQAQNLKERIPGAGSDEFGRLTASVNAMLNRLDDAFERQRRFAADASHELRTPLATIRATSSLALEEGFSDFTSAQYRTMLASIDSAADRATRVTQDLLFLARVGALPVRTERLAIRGTLEEARSAVIASAGKDRKLPRIVVDADSDRRLDSDRDHLLRLLINLIDNAARHTPEDGRVDVTAAFDARGAAMLTVADTGEGIPREHLARIREPFYRPDTARSRRSGGAGLGLAIAQGIVDALGGTLQIESMVHEGTTVTVTLPASVTGRSVY